MAALDIAIALTGVLVLAAAAFTTSMYLGRNEQNKQMEAVAAVGKNLEAIGMSGEEVLSAVAAAAQNVSEEVSEEETTETETGYEEKDLEANVDVILKLSSMQKDMKIKFADKNSGKLIGNQPFTVKLEGASSQNAKDDDKDGIIYLKDLKAGDYVVTVTGPDEISGRKAAGISGRVTVKDKIEYKKVDVTDEIKRSRRSTWRKRIPRLHRQWNRFCRILWNGLSPPKHRQETDRNMKRSASPISRSLPRQDFWSRR